MTIGSFAQTILLNGITKFSGSSRQKSNFFNRLGKVTLDISSIKVLPRQMREPPKKGLKENVFLL